MGPAVVLAVMVGREEMGIGPELSDSVAVGSKEEG